MQIAARCMTRRTCLQAGLAVGLAGAGVSHRKVFAAQTSRPHRAVPRPDLLEPGAGSGLEILQLTADPDIPSSHVYMEAQVFTPDSKRFVFHRSAHPHGSIRTDPRHQYVLCDIEHGFALHPLTDELGTTGPSISPDGLFLYYLVDETGSDGPLTLKRVKLDGTGRETLLVIDAQLPGTRFRPTRVYSLSSISSDGKKLAISACLDRTVTPVEYGLMVFDLENPCVEVVLHGSTWANVHPQFCRSTDPVLRRDILIQENHGHRMSAGGEQLPRDDAAGLDIHVIRDDGTDFRTLPWGRDGKEYCEGHQCWRGRSGWAITSVGVESGAELIESRPVSQSTHVGLKTPVGIRNRLTRDFADPQFHHFATDLAGRWVITDYRKAAPDARIYLARTGREGQHPLTEFTCLARPRPSGAKTSHMHPFLSPDGRMAFFNSDESGQLQAYMIRGVEG